VLEEGPLLVLELFTLELLVAAMAEVEDLHPLPDFKYAALFNLDCVGWLKPWAALGIV